MYPGLGVPCSHREASFGIQAMGSSNLAGEVQFGHLFGPTFCEFIGNCVMCLCVGCLSVFMWGMDGGEELEIEGKGPSRTYPRCCTV